MEILLYNQIYQIYTLYHKHIDEYGHSPSMMSLPSLFSVGAKVDFLEANDD